MAAYNPQNHTGTCITLLFWGSAGHSQQYLPWPKPPNLRASRRYYGIIFTQLYWASCPATL